MLVRLRELLSLEARIDQHKRRSASAISKAIKKYGWENFKAEVIEECKTRDQLNEREIFWIKFYDCIAPKGYNLHPGGRNHAMTEETRRRASEAQKKRYENPEAHRKLSVAQRKRFEDPAEHEKLSRAQKKYFSNPEARKKVPKQRKILQPKREQICQRLKRGVLQIQLPEQKKLRIQEDILRSILRHGNI